MVRIYHIPHFRSARVIWLMEELGEPYEVELAPFPLDEAFKQRTGVRAIPTVVDGDIVLGESIAILQYLTGRRLQRSLELGLTVGPSPDPAAYAEHLQLLHLGEASLMTPIALLARTRRLVPDEESSATAQNLGDLFRRRLAAVEDRLEDGRAFVTGASFTIADISIGYALAYARLRGFADLMSDGVRSYLDRLQARPAFGVAFPG